MPFRTSSGLGGHHGEWMSNVKVVLEQVVGQNSSEVHVLQQIAAAYDKLWRKYGVVHVRATQDVACSRKITSLESLIPVTK